MGLRVLMMVILLCACASGKPMKKHKFPPRHSPKPLHPPNHPSQHFIEFLVCVFNSTDASEFNFTKSAFEQLFSQFNSSSPCCFPRSLLYPPSFSFSDRRPFLHKYSPRKNPPFSPRNPPKPKFPPAQFIDFLVCVFNHTDVSEFNFTKLAFEYLFSQFNSSSPCPFSFPPRRPQHNPFFPLHRLLHSPNKPFPPPKDEKLAPEQPQKPGRGLTRSNQPPPPPGNDQDRPNQPPPPPPSGHGKGRPNQPPPPPPSGNDQDRPNQPPPPSGNDQNKPNQPSPPPPSGNGQNRPNQPSPPSGHGEGRLNQPPPPPGNDQDRPNQPPLPSPPGHGKDRPNQPPPRKDEPHARMSNNRS